VYRGSRCNKMKKKNFNKSFKENLNSFIKVLKNY